MLYSDNYFLDRFSMAADDGFSAVEFWFPYDHHVDQLSKTAKSAGLPVTVINTPPGNVETGEWGLSAVPGREEEFRDGFRLALDYASALSARFIHVMAGNSTEGSHSTYLENLEFALSLVEGKHVDILIEPLNHFDRPNYHLVDVERAVAIIEEFSTPALRMMFDFYHVQRTTGDALNMFLKSQLFIGHIQVASAPMRGEPDRGLIDYEEVFRELVRLDWQYPIGCEYFPKPSKRLSLDWITKLVDEAGKSE